MRTFEGRFATSHYYTTGVAYACQAVLIIALYCLIGLGVFCVLELPLVLRKPSPDFPLGKLLSLPNNRGVRYALDSTPKSVQIQDV